MSADSLNSFQDFKRSEILEEIDSIATFAHTLYVIPKGKITSEQKQNLAGISKATVLSNHHVVRFSIIATAEGCSAALSAEKYITKRKSVRPQWG